MKCKELYWIVERIMTRENVCACGVHIDFCLNTCYSCLVEVLATDHGDTRAAYIGFDFAVQNSNEEWSDDSVGKTLALKAQGLEFDPQHTLTKATSGGLCF